MLPVKAKPKRKQSEKTSPATSHELESSNDNQTRSINAASTHPCVRAALLRAVRQRFYQELQNSCEEYSTLSREMRVAACATALTAILTDFRVEVAAVLLAMVVEDTHVSGSSCSAAARRTTKYNQSYVLARMRCNQSTAAFVTIAEDISSQQLTSDESLIEMIEALKMDEYRKFRKGYDRTLRAFLREAFIAPTVDDSDPQFQRISREAEFKKSLFLWITANPQHPYCSELFCQQIDCEICRQYTTCIGDHLSTLNPQQASEEKVVGIDAQLDGYLQDINLQLRRRLQAFIQDGNKEGLEEFLTCVTKVLSSSSSCLPPLLPLSSSPPSSSNSSSSSSLSSLSSSPSSSSSFSPSDAFRVLSQEVQDLKNDMKLLQEDLLEQENRFSVESQLLR